VAGATKFYRTSCSSQALISDVGEMTASFQASWFAQICEIMTISKICDSSFYFIENDE